MKKPRDPSAISEIRDLGLVRRARDDDEEDEIQKPLEWSLIRRLFTYAAPVKRKLTALGVLTVIRAAQLPAFCHTATAARPDCAGASARAGGFMCLKPSAGRSTMPQLPSPDRDPNAELHGFEPLRAVLAIGALLLGLLLSL